jgi:hypothetical protein
VEKLDYISIQRGVKEYINKDTKYVDNFLLEIPLLLLLGEMFSISALYFFRGLFSKIYSKSSRSLFCKINGIVDSKYVWK